MDLTDSRSPAEVSIETAAQYGTRRLVAYIRDRFHEVHRRELADALALAEALRAAGAPSDLADLLRRMRALVEAHQHKEEAAIFPAMLRGGWRVFRLPLLQMAAEHAELERMSDELVGMTGGFQPPPNACVRHMLLYTLCRKIVADLGEHARLEDEVLYPRFPQFASAQRRPARDPVDGSHGAVTPRVSHRG